MQHSFFTHIVVGAGSAGCVVASRISQNTSYNVLLIEAGPDYGASGDVPPGVRSSRRVPMRGQSEIYDPKIDWNLIVEMPDSSSMAVPQAKLMGGGSSINGGTALRSTRGDSEEWVALGNDAWDWDSVYKVYQSLENDEARGTKGPHPIVRAAEKETGKIQKAFLKGANSCGFPSVFDLNATGAEGAGPSPVSCRGDDRVSTASTFIDPIRHLENLTILSESPADRVTFSNNRATGILLNSGQHILATHEVILSAGAILSPAILQRSGMGPSQLLQRHGIIPIADLPVGRSAYDHACIPIVAKPRPGSYDKDDYSLQCQARWSSTRCPGSIDHQLVCFSYLFAAAPELGIQQQRSLAGTTSGHVAGVGCNLNKPTSCGTISITSQNPHVLPTVIPNYLHTSIDRQSARELVRTGYRVITSLAMQAVLEPPLDLTGSIIKSDVLLDEYIRSHVTSTYHFCCTCPMASREKGGIVDQSGRVYGVRGLRVCDASIFPTVPASNTMWATVMVAERIGTSIRDGQEVGEVARTRL